MKGKRPFTGKRGLAGSLATMLLLLSVLLSVAAGCQPVFLSKEVYQDAYSKSSMLPAAAFEDNYAPIAKPITAATSAPATVDFPERRSRHLTLQEAIAHALENGLASGQAAEGTGTKTLPVFNGPGTLNNQTDRLRVLALNPAISSAAMETQLARFDAVWVTGMNWTNTDNLQQGLSSFNNGQGANFNSSLVKAFADGSVANVSWITTYTNLNAPPSGVFNVLNPQYTLRPSIGYEIPLWKDSGVEINQLLQRLSPFTGQALNNNSLAAIGYNAHQNQISQFLNQPTEGILVSKLRFDQTRAEFERNVQVLVKNVEIAYWNLYSKYGQLYSFEFNLRILQKAYQESFFQAKAGAKLKPYQFPQSRGQFEEFRANRIQALQEVLTAELNLRLIIGLPMEDGERLIPITPPTLQEIRPDWDMSLQDALNLRPELILARENLRYHQYLLTLQKNSLKPDLRFVARYEPVGFGNTLTGSGSFLDGTGTVRPANAFTSLRDLSFADYQLGVYLNVPIGQRAEHAAIRAGRLQLAQAFYFLRDAEEKATAYLTDQYQEVIHWWRRIEAHRAERKSYGEALDSYLNLIYGGQAVYSSLDFLQIQRFYAAALVKEYNAIAEYNNSLARLEWAKGATLRYNNVYISEGQLPQCAQVAATEREKDRSREIVLKQRPDSLLPIQHPGRFVVDREADLPRELPPVNIIQDNEGGRLPPIIDVQPAAGTSPSTPTLVDKLITPASGSNQKPDVIKPVIVPSPKAFDKMPVGTPASQPAPSTIKTIEVAPLMPLGDRPGPLPGAAPSPITRLSAPADGGSMGFVTSESSATPFLSGPDSAAARDAVQPITLSSASGTPPVPSQSNNFPSRR